MRVRAGIVAAVMVTAAASNGFGQAGRGTVTGTVTDAAGGSLQGAQITLSPGTVSALSDAQGQFTLPALAAGEYTLTVAYSGFAVSTQKVTVAGGQVVRAGVVMQISANSEGVNVYAGREGGEVEAINRTLNADNIINVLPADVITSLPNANVADAIGRLPSVTLERDEGEGKYVKVRGTEPRLTHTSLDGVTMASPETVRQLKLDLIPADLVESVQINKTLQANMEGDGIGGSVDLRTKSAENRPTINLESTGGYTPIIGGRPAYQFDGTLGRRFLEGKKLGALLSGSYDWNGRGINDVEPAPALQGTYDLRDYRYFRDRWGFGGTLDYRISDTSNLYLKGLYSHFNNFGDDWIYSPTINTFVGTSLTQGDVDGNVTFSALRRRPVQDIGGLQLGGHHVLGRSVFAWDVDSSIGRTRDDGYSTAHFAPISDSNPLNNVQYNLDVKNPLEPHLNVQNGVNIFDPTKYFLQNQQVNNFYNPEVDLGFGGSLAIPYTLSGHASTFEVGGRFRNEHKFVNQNSRTYYPNLVTINAKGKPVYVEDPTLAMSNFLNNFNDSNYYGGDYKFGPSVEYDKVRAFSAQSDRGINDTLGNSFDQIEKVSAGYVMNTTNLGKFRLVLGVRFENTGENNLGYNGQSSASKVGTTPIRVQTSYLNVLPSGSLRYGITPASGIRLVYGRGLARPNFSDLIPFASAPSGGTARNTISQGNPNLHAEYADNIDLLYESSLAHQGLLQAGFFYKHLSDPIVPTQTVQQPNPTLTGNNLPYILNQTINAGTGWVYGLEIAFQQHFTYLPGALNGLGLSANYAYTASRANLPPYVDPTTAPPGTVGSAKSLNRGPEGANPALIGQAPNSYNLSPTYDKKNLSVRLGMTYNQANIASYGYTTDNNGPVTQGGGGGGPKGPNGDNYFYSHLQVDMQASYKLPKGFTAVAYGLNLNNEVFGFYNGDPMYPVQREFYRQTFGGGLRWSPMREGK
jgi:TonB-dependent receptor